MGVALGDRSEGKSRHLTSEELSSQKTNAEWLPSPSTDRGSDQLPGCQREKQWGVSGAGTT